MLPKTMRSCLVANCDRFHNFEKRSMFYAPKDPQLLEQWEELLTLRNKLRTSDKICIKHFKKEDILTAWTHNINGEVQKLERAKPRIVPKSLPSLMLCIPNPAEPHKRRPYTKRASKSEIPKSESEIEIEFGSKENVQQRISEEDNLMHFEDLYDEVYEIELPHQLWGIHRDPDRNYMAFSCFNIENFSSCKSLILDNRLVLKAIVNGSVVKTEEISNISAQTISQKLSELDESQLCSGKMNKCTVFVTDSNIYCGACESAKEKRNPKIIVK